MKLDVSFAIHVSDPRQRIQCFIDAYNDDRNDSIYSFDDFIMRDNIMLDSVWTEPQTGAKFELDIKPAMCNRMGNLHGGAAATIFDMCTTIAAAPLAKEGFWDFGGVSRTLSVTYMRPVPVNIKVLVECTVMQIGKRLVVLTGIMRRKSDNVILCMAEHHKVYVALSPEKSKI